MIPAKSDAVIFVEAGVFDCSAVVVGTGELCRVGYFTTRILTFLVSGDDFCTKCRIGSLEVAFIELRPLYLSGLNSRPRGLFEASEGLPSASYNSYLRHVFL